jgi:hypothetical protein
MSGDYRALAAINIGIGTPKLQLYRVLSRTEVQLYRVFGDPVGSALQGASVILGPVTLYIYGVLPTVNSQFNWSWRSVSQSLFYENSAYPVTCNKKLRTNQKNPLSLGVVLCERC